MEGNFERVKCWCVRVRYWGSPRSGNWNFKCLSENDLMNDSLEFYGYFKCSFDYSLLVYSKPMFFYPQISPANQVHKRQAGAFPSCTVQVVTTSCSSCSTLIGFSVANWKLINNDINDPWEGTYSTLRLLSVSMQRVRYTFVQLKWVWSA